MNNLSLSFKLFFFSILLLNSSCNTLPTTYTQNGFNKSLNNVQPGSKLNLEWNIIDLPFAGEIFASHEKDVFVIGTEGIALLKQNNEIQKLQSSETRHLFLTNEGKITRAPPGSKEITKKNSGIPLCHPEMSAFFSDNLYVLAKCESKAQLWKVDLNRNTSFDLVHFADNGIENNSKNLFEPTGLFAYDNKVLFSAFAKDKPALLTEDKKTGNLKIVWNGTSEIGSIVAIDFIDKNGLMLLSTGKIFRSFEGETWQHFSNTPSATENRLITLKFRNEKDGYIAGLNGKVLHTIDGGKTWDFQESGTNETLYKIDLDDNYTVICGADGILIVNKKGENNWSQIKTKPEGNINDILLNGGNLYLLIEGKVYTTKL